jgi:hypothetical protein
MVEFFLKDDNNNNDDDDDDDNYNCELFSADPTHLFEPYLLF